MADAGAESESLRLKTLAEEQYMAGNLKSALKHAKRAHHLHSSLDGAEELLKSLEILQTVAAPISAALPDYYGILQIERFANITVIKKQFRKLALALHPDKNPFAASEEAFKYVGEGFGVLSDRVKRKEYDTKVRLAMQAEAAAAAADGGAGAEEIVTFSSSCSNCRLLHKFERKYLGQVLVCPSCKKSFQAEEAAEEEEEEESDEVDASVRCSERIKARRKAGKMVSVVDVLARSRWVVGEKDLESVGKKKGFGENEVGMRTRVGAKKVVEEDMMTLADLQSSVKKKVVKVNEVGMRTRAGAKKVMEEKEEEEEEEDMTTLADMQSSVKVTAGKDSKMRVEMENEKEQDEEDVSEKDIGDTNVEEEEEESRDQDEQLAYEDEDEDEEEEEDSDHESVEEEESEESEEEEEIVKQKINRKRKMGVKEVMERENMQRKEVSNDDVVAVTRKTSRSNGDLSMSRCKRSRQADLKIPLTRNSDFHEFDKDRNERSFKKGQVWAIYDSEDGMPRHYGLIDNVVSVDPFEVNLSWLEHESSGDRQPMSRERMGVYVSCGRFKVSEKATVRSLKMFSHLAGCERAAREVYRIFPKKGSVWAIHREHSGRSNQTAAEELRYDIVVFLTSYSDLLGSSMAYLDKVDGFKTTFTRREIGHRAIRVFEKDELKRLSHEIPRKKLSGEEAPKLPKYCWELDPVSVPPSALSSS